MDFFQVDPTLLYFPPPPCESGYFPVAAEGGVVRGLAARLVGHGLVLPRELLEGLGVNPYMMSPPSGLGGCQKCDESTGLR